MTGRELEKQIQQVQNTFRAVAKARHTHWK
jgi:hypothetical protein